MTNDKFQMSNDGVRLRRTYHKMPKAYLHLSFLIFNLSFYLLAPAFAQTSTDPSTIGIGARALGMGRAYTAVAEDADTIFNNPAGLGEIDNFKLTSMSGKILEEVQYTMLGGVYPMGDKTAIGVGYVASTVSGIEIRDSIGNLLSESDFTRAVFLASFGKKITDQFSFGLNFKYFFQSGSEIEDGNGTGMNGDFGILFKGLNWLSLGFVGQNIFKSGKISSGGTEEDLPLTVKIGSKINLFGQDFESAIIAPFKVITTTDIAFSLQTSRPSTTHLGIEISPVPFLTFRSGLDQDPVPGGIESNFTYGLSLKYAGIAFHYAYHPYTESSQNATQFLSISFDERGWPVEELPDTHLGTIFNGVASF
jgi:hypothetical protein